MKDKVMGSPDQAVKFATAVRMLIGSQLALTHWDEQDLPRSDFGLGYLMGLCDALAQKHSIPQPQDLLVIGSTFALLYPHHPQIFVRALSLVDDPKFIAGQDIGGKDLFGALSPEKLVPFGLVDQWKAERFPIVRR